MAAQVLGNFQLSFFFPCILYKANLVRIDKVVLFMFTVLISGIFFFLFEVNSNLQTPLLFITSNEYW